MKILYHNQLISHGDFCSIVSGFADYLDTLCLPPHSLVAFLAHPTLHHIAFLFALWERKLTGCPLNPRFPDLVLKQILSTLNFSSFIEPEKISLNPKNEKKTMEFDPSFIGVMILTSGSMGKPKIGCLSMENIFENAKIASSYLQLTSEDYYLLSLPLFHISGLATVCRAFIADATLVISNEKREIPDGVTHISMVPTQLYSLLEKGKKEVEEKISKVKCILLGGAPLSPVLYHKAVQFGTPVYTTYGLTEMSSMVSLNRSREELTSGPVLPCSELKIAKDGEILVKGKTLFKGYLQEDQSIDLPLEEGWFATKDLGMLNEKNELICLGRKDRLFISGGEKIRPEEIEAILLTFPEIREARVLPQEDPKWGMRPVAYLFSMAKDLSIKKIQEELKARLPYYKLPKEFVVMKNENQFRSVLKLPSKGLEAE
ncbi:MAG: AMP-binding protein [Chlamydiae bacterium]|nr:AMP-binding protein [Chlamydiota bacterium]